MRNVSVKEAARVAGDPYVEIAATRGLSDGVTIPVLDEDYTGEALSCLLALGPGFPVLATLPMTVTTETNSWQHHIDCDGVRKQDIPCDTVLTADVTTSLLNLSWSTSSFSGVPSSTIASKPVTVYYEIRRTDGTGPNFVVGDFIVTERIL